MNNNITRKAMYEAITAAGVALHPCNAADTVPEGGDVMYYLTTKELTGIYADITEEQTTDTEEEEEEQHQMTYKEYMQEHDEENISWCKPMMSDDGQYGIIMTDAKPSVIILDGKTMNATDENVKKLAHAVTDDDDYDLLATLGGWSDVEIVMESDKLHEYGCSSCPMIHECEAMSETIEP